MLEHKTEGKGSKHHTSKPQGLFSSSLVLHIAYTEYLLEGSRASETSGSTIFWFCVCVLDNLMQFVCNKI